MGGRTSDIDRQDFAFSRVATRFIRTHLASARTFRSYVLDEVIRRLTVTLGTASCVDRIIDYKILVVD